MVDNHQPGFTSKTTYHAAASGDLDSLIYAHEHGRPWDPQTTYVAKTLAIVKYAHENGCPWHPQTMLNEPLRGNLEFLQYAHEHGCPWNHMAMSYWCSSVALALECIEYAHKNGCPWGTKLTYDAVYWNRMDILKYAHEHGCDWSPDTTYVAARYGNKEALQYAYENGCPWDQYTTVIAAQHGHKECLEYIFENCGDIVTWERSGLEMFSSPRFSEIIQYIEEIKEYWKAGNNHPGRNIKGC